MGTGYLFRRFLGLLIDGGLALALTQIPGAGAALAVGFFLSRDWLPGKIIRVPGLRGRSPGKALMGLQVLAGEEGTGEITLRSSMMRSLPLLLGVLFGVVISPVFSAFEIGFAQGLVRGPDLLMIAILGVIPLLGESWALLRDPRRRRWGDGVAQTWVRPVSRI